MKTSIRSSRCRIASLFLHRKTFCSSSDWEVSAPKRLSSPTGNNKWKDLSKHRTELNDVYTKLKLTSLDDWYQVTWRNLAAIQKLSLFNSYYNGSIMKALISNYPEHNWVVSRFRTRANILPSEFFDDLQQQRLFMDNMGRNLNLKHWTDWYRVTFDNIAQNGGMTLLHRYNHSIHQILANLYPEHRWQNRFEAASNPLVKTGYTKAQSHLLSAVQDIFAESFNSTSIKSTEVSSDEDLGIHANFLHQNLKSRNGKPYELDIYIPYHKLAFEYQGHQHYKAPPQQELLFGDFTKRVEMDTQKKKACESVGITLIQIPYWWNGRKDSLVATIHEHLPDLFERGVLNLSGDAAAIPAQPPYKTYTKDSVYTPKRKNHMKIRIKE